MARRTVIGLSRHQQLLVAGNAAAVLLFATWAWLALAGIILVPLCCDAPNYIEGALAIVNAPSFFAGFVLSKWLAPDSLPHQVAVRHVVWVALVVPQWLGYVWVYRKLRHA